MKAFKTGTVLFDDHLKLIKGDRDFFAFIMWENSMFLEQSVYREDFAEVKNVCDMVWNTGEKAYLTYRVFCQDGSTPWVVGCVSRQKLAGKDVLELNIQSVDAIEQDMTIMENELCEFGTYMDIMDELFFRYDIERDEFCIFMGGRKQRIVVFSGKLEEWTQKLQEKDSFAEYKYLEIHENFCQDLKQGANHFSHEIMLPHLLKGEEKELYLVKGRTVVNHSGNVLVLGCIYTMSKNYDRRKAKTGSDFVKDEMTGLLSKQTIINYICNAFSEAPAAGKSHYICILDIDDFKYVNDNYGHLFGDEVLITVSDILKEAVGRRGVVGRIGGDEMLIFLENISDRADLKSILRTIRSNVEWTYRESRAGLHLSCSIGAASWPLDAKDYDTLFKIADKMLYRAKENGKNRYIIYTPEIHGDVLNTTPKETGKNVSVKISDAGNKEHFLMELTEYFMFRAVWNVQKVLEETGTVFGLKEVNVFYDDPPYEAMHWRKDGKTVDAKFLCYAGTTQFRQLFDENNLAVIHSVTNLQFVCPEAYEFLSGQQVTAALIYRMDNGVPGYVTFYKEEQASRLWSDSDKAFLNVIGKMIALFISGK